MKKKRILMSTEASYILSGFGKYTHQVLKRLNDTGKYVIAEFASYGPINDPRDKSVEWMYYANSVNDNDPRAGAYKQDAFNQFGKWRFNKVALDFKPDIVFDIRDTQMIEHVKDSPYRKLFHWAIMPTVDSAPQQECWIDTYTHADGVFTYCDYGMSVLKEEGRDLLKLQCPAPPGVDINVFQPVKNKTHHKRGMSFDEDMVIIGTIMRNQKRKLFPDLIDGFKQYLTLCYANGAKKLADRTYLYLHTSYPDAGWDIPKLVKECGIGHKLIFTYCCKRCKSNFAAFFQDARTVCPHCKTNAAVLPSVGTGLTDAELAQVLNLFDVYVQYANCEGFGMPMVEAAACGLPIMAVDYSAMGDVVRKLNGYTIPVQKKFRELETGANRVYPDNAMLAERLYKFFTQPAAMIQRKGFQARKGVEEYYTWDKTAKIWESYFDSIELVGAQGKWDTSPYSAFEPKTSMPAENMSNSEFLDWAITNVLNRPELKNTYFSMTILRDLNYGVSIQYGRGVGPFHREDVMRMFLAQTNEKNYFENLRCGFMPIPKEDYIDYAHSKMKQNEKNTIYRPV